MPATDITYSMRDLSPAQVVADRAAREAWRRAERGSAALLAALHKYHPGPDREQPIQQFKVETCRWLARYSRPTRRRRITSRSIDWDTRRRRASKSCALSLHEFTLYP